jgi:hypothetical protein
VFPPLGRYRQAKELKELTPEDKRSERPEVKDPQRYKRTED